MRGIQDMMKKAQAMQAKVMEAEERIKSLEAEGSAGGGMVKITLKGTENVSGVEVDPSLLEPSEKEVLEDLIAAAFTDARKKMEALSKEERNKAMGGFQLPPGFNMPGL